MAAAAVRQGAVAVALAPLHAKAAAQLRAAAGALRAEAVVVELSRRAAAAIAWLEEA